MKILAKKIFLSLYIIFFTSSISSSCEIYGESNDQEVRKKVSNILSKIYSGKDDNGSLTTTIQLINNLIDFQSVEFEELNKKISSSGFNVFLEPVNILQIEKLTDSIVSIEGLQAYLSAAEKRLDDYLLGLQKEIIALPTADKRFKNALLIGLRIGKDSSFLKQIYKLHAELFTDTRELLNFLISTYDKFVYDGQFILFEVEDDYKVCNAWLDKIHLCKTKMSELALRQKADITFNDYPTTIGF